jgi:hypothetical protein
MASFRTPPLDCFFLLVAATSLLLIPILTEYVASPFSAVYFLGHGFGLIPAPGSFTASAFTVPPEMHWFPPIKQPLALGAAASRFWVPQENGAEKGDSKKCLTLTQ